MNSSVSSLFWPVGQKQTVMRVHVGRVGRIVADESSKMNSVDEPDSGYIFHPHRKRIVYFKMAATEVLRLGTVLCVAVS